MEEIEKKNNIKEIVEHSGGACIYLSGSYMERALKLLEISEGFYRVLLFTHMEDIIPVIAYSNPRWKRPVYFYNHADCHKYNCPVKFPSLFMHDKGNESNSQHV